MHVTNKRWSEVWKCEMENVVIWGRFWVHHEADRNSLNSCQLIPTHYMTNIKLKRVEQMNGSRMKDMEWIMNDKQAKIKVPRGQSTRITCVVRTPSLVLCCAWLVTMALHVHGGLGQLSPLPTSGDDKWVAAYKHCGRAKRSRIIKRHWPTGCGQAYSSAI